MNGKIIWTKHAKKKIKQYRLSEKRVLRILRKPDRKEEGIAIGTIAQMQITGTKKHPTEAWMMYQLINLKSKIQNQNAQNHLSARPSTKQNVLRFGPKIKIISAWRYPGRTSAGQKPTIPDDVLQELLKEGII